MQRFRPFRDRTIPELFNVYLFSKLASYSWLMRQTNYLLESSAKFIGINNVCFYLGKTVGTVFSAGETVEDLVNCISRLSRLKQYTMIDYCAEGEKTDEGFENTAKEIKKTVRAITVVPGTSVAIKLTGLVPEEILNKMNIVQLQAGDPFKHSILEDFTEQGLSRFFTLNEVAEIYKCQDRLVALINYINNSNCLVFIDAEQTAYQKAIDCWAFKLQGIVNTRKGVLGSTFQCYLTDSEQRLKSYIEMSRSRNIALGVKLVRGAYINEENNLARMRETESPIHPSKDKTDSVYNDCVEHLLSVHSPSDILCIATHNTESTERAKSLLAKYRIHRQLGGVSFAQLLGMKTSLSAQLANEHYRVVKYVPFGPLIRLIPYLLRRAVEQTEMLKELEEQISEVKQELKHRISP